MVLLVVLFFLFFLLVLFFFCEREQEVVLQAKMLGLANGGPGEPDSAAGFLSQVLVYDVVQG